MYTYISEAIFSMVNALDSWENVYSISKAGEQVRKMKKTESGHHD